MILELGLIEFVVVEGSEAAGETPEALIRRVNGAEREEDETIDERSDLDFIVVTHEDIPPDQVPALQALHDRLRRAETSIVPGHFFDEPRHFRLGFAVRHDDVAQGLRHLGEALRAGA